jgi:hypothetical protein
LYVLERSKQKGRLNTCVWTSSTSISMGPKGMLCFWQWSKLLAVRY